MPKKISKLLFDKRDHELIRIVNSVLRRETSDEFTRRHYYPYFHPHGIKEMTETKGLRTAYAVIHLLNSLEVGGVDDRTKALYYLRKEVLDTAEGPMPKNTARVLLQIMKDLVRAHGAYRRQLELAHDFRITASGKPRIVRRQLRRYHLLEMPEEWNQIAFDDHVHDVNTKGRKSSTHLIMDAWIKGIRRLRVIHYHFIEPRFAAELLVAAGILEMDIRIGIEFSAKFRNQYVQLIWVPRGFVDAPSFLCFLAEPEVIKIMDAGRKASQYQQQRVMALLRKFNETHRLEINGCYGIDLAPLEEKGFRAYVGIGQMSKLHLAKYVHEQILEAIKKRVSTMREEFPTATAERRREISNWVASMNTLDLEAMVDGYLGFEKNPELTGSDASDNGPELPELLRLTPHELLSRLAELKSGYRVTLNLTNIEAHDVLELLYDCQGKISRLEIFNLKDQAAGKTAHITEISRLQQAINESSAIKLKRVIREIIDRYSASDSADKSRIEKLTAILYDIDTLMAYYAGRPLKARIGSDSTGRSPKVHGMGLAIKETLPAKAQRQIVRDTRSKIREIIPIKIIAYRGVTYVPKAGASPINRVLGRLASRFPTLIRLGFDARPGWEVQAASTRMANPGNIVTLGGVQKEIVNGLNLHPPEAEEKGARIRWQYLNSSLKNVLKVLIGFIPAFATFALTKDWWVLAYLGAFIWFGITGLRNVLQSVLGGGGLRRSPLLNWHDYISWTRITDSLLFTGFSVPLLDYVVKTVLLDRTFDITTASNPVLLYTFMALANGVYLSSHNAFRGFPSGVVYGNFFRSVLSIPIAIGLNVVIGSILQMAGVVGVAPVLQKWAAIISKAASDFVAAIIEGTADRYNNIHMRFREYLNKFRELLEIYAQLELLFPEVQTFTVLAYSSKNKRKANAEARDLEKVIMIHALDLMYFWLYQPRSRGALRQLLHTLSEDERHILVSSQYTLLRHREISQMFIDGILGNSFQRPLSFYLSHYEAYLEDVKRLILHEGFKDSREWDDQVAFAAETPLPDKPHESGEAGIKAAAVHPRYICTR